MGQFNVQMPDGSVRSVQGTTLAAAINNAGAGASAPSSSSPAQSSSSTSAAPAPQSAPASSSQYGAGQGYWSTINGPRTVPQMAAELAKVGYNGPTDPGNIMSAYARTAGGQVKADNTDNLPGGAGPTPQALAQFGQQPAPQQPAAATDPFAQDILNAFQQSSGFSLADLAEKKREFDATLQQQKDMWQQQGLPQLVIQQKAQALAEQEFQAQTALAQSNLGETYLKDAAGLSGPADYFQQDDFLRGARQRADVPVFLQALRDNTQLPNGAGGGTPTPASMGNLADRLTGSPSIGLPSTTPGTMTAQTPGVTANGTGTNTDAALGTISGILAKGGGALGPQALEQLNPDEMALVQSGANKLGYSMPAFLQQYQQSRVGQSSAQAA